MTHQSPPLLLICTKETQNDFHSPLYEDSKSIFQKEDFLESLMDQFLKVLKISNEINFEDVPILVTNATNLEKQLQELQRKLIEKDVEIATLAT